jgi:hypothetical protein
MSRARTHHAPYGAELRLALVRMLQGGRAHAPLAESLRSFPRALTGKKPRGAPHTAWELLEHLRIAQSDILEFSLDPEHESPPWPEGFWPKSAKPPSKSAWDASTRAFLRDLRKLVTIAQDPRRDLGHTIPGTTTSWLGQLGLVAGHNSYHLGQLFFLQRTLEAGKR